MDVKDDIFEAVTICENQLNDTMDELNKIKHSKKWFAEREEEHGYSFQDLSESLDMIKENLGIWHDEEYDGEEDDEDILGDIDEE